MKYGIAEMKRVILANVKHLFSTIPIIGALGHIGGAAKKEASIEMILTLLFSTLPIWFGGIILSANYYFGKLTESNRTASEFLAAYRSSLFLTISNGELLMYAAATLGPTLYLGFSSFGKRIKPFPWVRPQLVIAIIINLFASVLFFMARDKGYAGEPVFVYVTIFLYFFSLLLLFPAMAYDHQTRSVDPSEIQREDQDEFMAGYKKRKERGE
jgi:hypothetical protein